MKLDKWQEEVLVHEGNICLCSGRQVGKSTIIAIKAGEYAVKNRNKSILIIASVERQALLLFEKTLSHIYENHKEYIMKGKDKPTKHELRLKNGSIIRCLPTGMSGYGIRGYTIDVLYADEAHFIPEDVWAAVTPMLATTGGTINLLSTPFGAQGYFYRCFHDPKFKAFHISTEEVAESREDPQKTHMLEFLKDEKIRMSKLQYRQEYLGEFVGGIQRYFSDQAIEECCIIREGDIIPHKKTFLGVDVARMGGDDTVLTSLDKREKLLVMFDLEITDHTVLTETTRLILKKNAQFDYKKIYIDTTGMGWGVYDPLREHPKTKRKVVPIENAKFPMETRGMGKPEQRKVTPKEHLYNNLRNLMDNNKIQLFNNPEVIQSLRSIQYEISDDKRLRIYGNYSHIVEALIRAAWCMKDKTLNMYIY